MTESNLCFMALSFKHWFLTLLPLPEVTYPLNYEFLRTGRYRGSKTMFGKLADKLVVD